MVRFACGGLVLCLDQLACDERVDILDLVFDVVCVLLEDNVLDELLLSSQDNIPQLLKVLFDVVCIVFVFVEELAREATEHLIVTHKLFQERIDDAGVV